MNAKSQLDKLIDITERGTLNGANLSAMEAAGVYFIVEAKLRQFPPVQSAYH